MATFEHFFIVSLRLHH